MATTSPQLSRGRRHDSRPPTKGDRTEAALLDAAWDLLARKPLSDITIEEIAAGAGISRPTFYFYFRSKEQLTHALAHRVAQEIRDTATAFFEPGEGTARDVVRRGVAGYMRRWREKGAILRAMAIVGASDGALQTFWDEVTDELMQELASGIEAERRAGRMPPGPPAIDLMRALFAMLWKSGHDLSVRPPSPKDEKRLVDTLTTVIVRALYGEAETT